LNFTGKNILVQNLPHELEPALQKAADKKRISLILLDDENSKDLISVRKEVNEVARKTGTIDVLLIFCPPIKATGPIKSTPISVFDENLKELWKILNALYAVYPHMMLARRGRIMLVHSSAGFEGFPSHAPGCTIAGALSGLFETFALEASEFNTCISILHQPLLNSQMINSFGSKQVKLEVKQKQANIIKSIFKALKRNGQILLNTKSVQKIKRQKLKLRPKEFKNKIILITGAASGIGRAFANAFSKAGASTVLLDINTRELKHVHSIIASRGQESTAIQLDLRDRNAIDDASKQVIDRFGNIDMLINNAGIAISGILRDLSLEDFKKTLDINLMAPIYLVEKFLPRMLGKQSGHVINIASIDARCPLPMLSPYNAAKRGIRFYSNILRMEVEKHGIGVTTVYPGAVSTNIALNATVRTKSLSNDLLANKETILRGNIVNVFTPDMLVGKIIKGLRDGDPNQHLLPISNKLLLNPWMKSPELVLPFLRSAITGMIYRFQAET